MAREFNEYGIQLEDCDSLRRVFAREIGAASREKRQCSTTSRRNRPMRPGVGVIGPGVVREGG